MKCPYCKEEVMDGALKCIHCGSAIGPASNAGSPEATDFAGLFNNAFTIWKNNLGDLAIMTLVFILVCWIPIANIGFIAGYTRSVIKVARGQGRAQVGDIFNSWDCFGSLFVYFLLFMVTIIILNLVPIIGWLASMALGFLIVPGVYGIIDGGMGAIEAFKWGIETIKADFLGWFLVYLVGNVVNVAGIIVLFIGVIISAPLGTLIVVQQYEKCKPPVKQNAGSAALAGN
jgi:hypothetical protein